MDREVCALQVGKSIETPGQSVPGPLSGCAQELAPVPPFLSVQTCGASSSQSSRRPFRQKYLLLQCWVCARLNLFKELAIMETYVCGCFFLQVWNQTS